MPAKVLHSVCLLSFLTYWSCQPAAETQQTPSVETPRPLISEIDSRRSLVTWIAQGEELINGAIKIDSGALSFEPSTNKLSGQWITEDISFGVSDTVGHRLKIAISNILSLDSVTLDSSRIVEDFKLVKPTHIATVSLMMHDSTGLSMVPIRLGDYKDGTELEGKVTVAGSALSGKVSWERFHVGFLIYTDKIE